MASTKDRLIRDILSTLEDHRRRDEHVQRRLASARRALDEVARLPQDWDSYGARAPTGAAVSAAYGLLAALWEHLGEAAGEDAVPWAIAPLADGGVQFEWHGPSDMIEVEIGPGGDFDYLVERDEVTTERSDPSTGTSTEAVIGHIRRVLDDSSEA